MILCGIDEAGRGPLAGPVTAAAVVLQTMPGKQSDLITLLADSKKLSPTTRAALARRVKQEAGLWGIGWANHTEIDRLNILYASHLAMRRALIAVLYEASCRSVQADQLACIVDGSVLPDLPLPTRAIVKADGTVPEVMAASILAKEARDTWMIRYNAIDDRYGFAAHKGYPTRLHREKLAEYGPCTIHRRSFRPCQIDPFPSAL